MSEAVSAIEPTSSVEKSGIGAFIRNSIDELKAQEANIHESFAEGLRPDGHLMKLPDHVSDQFKRWENTFTSPEDKALVSEVKRKVIEMSESNSAYIRERVDGNTEKIRLELAMKAVSKTTQGIQQLLSAQ